MGADEWLDEKVHRGSLEVSWAQEILSCGIGALLSSQYVIVFTNPEVLQTP